MIGVDTFGYYWSKVSRGRRMIKVVIKYALNFTAMIFIESAPKPIQSRRSSVCLFVCGVCFLMSLDIYVWSQKN